MVIRLARPKVQLQLDEAGNLIRRMIAGGGRRGVMLFGPKGIGKDKIAEAEYAATGVDLIPIPDATVHGMRGAVARYPMGHFQLSDFDGWMKDVKFLNFFKQGLNPTGTHLIGAINARTVAKLDERAASAFRVIVTSNADPDALKPEARRHFEAIEDRVWIVNISRDPIDLLPFLDYWIVELNYCDTVTFHNESGISRRLSLIEVQSILDFIHVHAWRLPLSLRMVRDLAVERVLSPNDWNCRFEALQLLRTPARNDTPPPAPRMFGRNEREGLPIRPTGYERREAKRLATRMLQTTEQGDTPQSEDAEPERPSSPTTEPAHDPPWTEGDGYRLLMTQGYLIDNEPFSTNTALLAGRNLFEPSVSTRFEGLADPDDIPEAAEPISVTGDLWIMGPHRVYVGNSTKSEDVARLMGDALADVSASSPPYLDQRMYEADFGDWDTLMQGAFSVMPVKPDAQLLVNLGLVHRDGVCLLYWEAWVKWMAEQGWRLFGFYVWDKLSGAPGDWHGRLAPSHELIFHFSRAAGEVRKTKEKKPESIRYKKGGLRDKAGRLQEANSPEAGLQKYKVPDSVIRVPRHNSRGIEHEHPAIFPAEFAVELITPFSGPGGRIYDPFAGSGTMIIAAEMTGRVCYCMEISPRYVDICVRRWEKFTGQPATLDNDGRTFAMVCAERRANRTGK